ncbi:hypothetical protein BKA66DRAFT_457568 [Pyrenochaeta sp. MPI-SDFR-AT-0127]|nr:hypothetical protein BKA66DRAFT_457568 [Pyrenochaeta sp. MPI-SDFR-AT-0127]
MAVDLKENNVPVILLHSGMVKIHLDRRWKAARAESVQGAVEPEVAAGDLWRVS